MLLHKSIMIHANTNYNACQYIHAGRKPVTFTEIWYNTQYNFTDVYFVVMESWDTGCLDSNSIDFSRNELRFSFQKSLTSEFSEKSPNSQNSQKKQPEACTLSQGSLSVCGMSLRHCTPWVKWQRMQIQQSFMQFISHSKGHNKGHELSWATMANSKLYLLQYYVPYENNCSHLALQPCLRMEDGPNGLSWWPEFNSMSQSSQLALQFLI